MSITKKSGRRLLYLVLAVAVIAVSVPVAVYVLYPRGGEAPASNSSSSGGATESSTIDVASYLYRVLRAVKPYNPYIAAAVPTTVVIGADGRAVAVVQGAVLDADYWRSLLSSTSGGVMLVVAGGASVIVSDTRVISEVEGAVRDLCLRAGVNLAESTAVIFGSSLCPHCRHLKELFDSSGIRYVFADLATNTVTVPLPRGVQ